ncbi:hypothetical protein [uncultured Clostridium sp.]|uniref:hypothetical protein n=1 Tax=uncultured Clostridium sp. TaxID=59620 RepID=UPI0026EE4518|nr:hypothetical protein [uncultured Clostridium sp.]
MSDTLITVVAILLAAILMFVFPLLSISERGDDISQLSVNSAVTEFVDNSRAIGKITMDNYNKLVNTIYATGNSYDIEMEVKVLDENIGKKSAWTQGTVIGENVYYSVYTSQITEVLEDKGIYTMKEGDIFSCSVKNTNKTLSQTIRSVFYSIKGSDTYSIAAQHAGVCTANGSN